jgi:hypothetical protein
MREVIVPCSMPRRRGMRLDQTIILTPPPAAQRIARQTLLLRTFRSWPKRVKRRLTIEIAAGRPVQAWEIHQAFRKYGGVTPFLGGAPMLLSVSEALAHHR